MARLISARSMLPCSGATERLSFQSTGGESIRSLRDFFWRCSLGGRYSVSVESKLAQDIGRIDAILSGKAKPGIREQNLLMADIGRLKTARPVSFHGLLITIGPRDEGTAIAIGLVPSTGRVPPLDP
jgi:hypothetical protein